ncbi:MAG: cell wall-binding repeat-containing protein, partial [Acidimicrobiales bacterium]
MFLTTVGVTPAAAVSIQTIAGQTPIATAIQISKSEFPTSQSAGAVVLASSGSGSYSDAIAGGPLAAREGGPLLLTEPAPSSLDPTVQTEIQRVLPTGKTVYILGGTLALSASIDTTLQDLGYQTSRLSGSDGAATAVAIAGMLGDPSTIFEATYTSFTDALSAVPAAIKVGGAILFTDESAQAPETATYLAAHPSDTRYAIGGPLAAYGADPTATPVYGEDFYGTSVAVASRFFPNTATFGAASTVNGADWTDGATGGVYMGRSPHVGPVLLVPTSGALPPMVANYLTAISPATGYVFGGTSAVGTDVVSKLGSTTASKVGTPAPAAANPAPVDSLYESPSSVEVSRDGGYSVLLPDGADLWLFGDTQPFLNGSQTPFTTLFGTTAAEGVTAPGLIPNNLMEVPTPAQTPTTQPPSLSPSTAPQPFLPAPAVFGYTTKVNADKSHTFTTTSGSCPFPARWDRGAALMPGDQDVLLPYLDVCEDPGNVNGDVFMTEGWGFAEYNWAMNYFDVPPYDVFGPKP